ncbi:hypothetical protein ACNARU_04760 [Proteus sp. WDL240414]|uniref:Uncharacterized protein n=1 Tax=Proteus genomosp. 6 TaxID=1311820 RepID=A0ABV1L8K4_9GAMM
MKISETQATLSSYIDKVKNKIGKEFKFIKNISSIDNSSVSFDKEKRAEILQENYSKYIEECKNLLNRTKPDIYKSHL